MTIENAINAVTGEQVAVQGSGRTDAGAHALHQVVAFSTGSSLAPHILQRALNANLPLDVAVTDAREVAGGFNPRFDAHSRHYRYLIWNRETRSPFWNGRAAHVRRRLDVHAMNEAAACLVGTHDFSSFVPAADPGNHVRRMDEATCRREGDLVIVDLRASGFMKQMVRSIVGTLILVGSAKLAPATVRQILAARDRARGGQTAPAFGLYLQDVRYASPAGGGESEEME